MCGHELEGYEYYDMDPQRPLGLKFEMGSCGIREGSSRDISPTASGAKFPAANGTEVATRNQD